MKILNKVKLNDYGACKTLISQDGVEPRDEMKGFVARTQDSRANPKAILGEEGLDWMRTRTEACLPLLQWLSA